METGVVAGGSSIFLRDGPLDQASDRSSRWGYRRRPFHSEGPVHGCSFSNTPSATCTFTAGPFDDYSYVGYRMVATNSHNQESSEGYIYFQAGAPRDTEAPIPVYYRGPSDEKHDVVFVRDTDYSGDEQAFYEDVEDLIVLGYFASAQLFPERSHFNFYLTEVEADAEAGCSLTEPENMDELSSMDGIAIVHLTDFRDCRSGDLFSTEGYSYRTVVHESGHALFWLADEYCCDGGYWEASHYPNLFESLANCETYASIYGFQPGDCQCFTANDGEDWCWICGTGGIMNTFDTTVYPFGPACELRLQKWYWM